MKKSKLLQRMMAMSWNKKTDVFALMTGHGRSLDGSWDPGCTYGGYTEAALMQNITKTAIRYLRQSGVIVISDSDNANNKNMTECVSWANKAGAKYYMSVHCDYSGASAGVYPLYVSSSGKKMAKSIGKSVAKDMKMKYKGAGKRSDLYELNATSMPAVVFESGSIKADLTSLRTYSQYGKAFAKAICKFLGVTFIISSGIVLPPRGYFKQGDIGENVRVLQKWLNDHGFDCGSADSIYGIKTVLAVKRFQRRYGLEADGLFGPMCLTKADSFYK